MTQPRTQLTFFFILLILGGGLAAAMFLPFLGTVTLGATFAVALYPLHRRLVKFLGGQEVISALLSMILGAVVLLVPIGLFGLRIFQESADLYAQLSTGQRWLSHIANDVVLRDLRVVYPGLQINVNDILRQGVAWLVGDLGTIFTGTMQGVINAFVFIISMFYVLKDGERFKQALIHYSPWPDQYDHEIYGRLTKAVRSILMGSIMVALVQGFFTGIGLALFGVPNATLWGGVAAICGLVPGMATTLVILPALIYIDTTAGAGPALGLALWALFSIGVIDNVIGPALVGRGVRIHPFFVLMAVVSGIGFFGPAGIVFGPLLLSFLFALLDIYRLLVLKAKPKA